MENLSAETAPKCLEVLINAIGTSDLLYVLYALSYLAQKDGLGLLPASSHLTTGLTALEAAIKPGRNPRMQSRDERKLADTVREHILRVLLVSGCRPTLLTPAASTALKRATTFEDFVAVELFREWEETQGAGKQWDDSQKLLEREVDEVLEADLVQAGLNYIAPEAEELVPLEAESEDMIQADDEDDVAPIQTLPGPSQPADLAPPPTTSPVRAPSDILGTSIELMASQYPSPTLQPPKREPTATPPPRDPALLVTPSHEQQPAPAPPSTSARVLLSNLPSDTAREEIWTKLSQNVALVDKVELHHPRPGEAVVSFRDGGPEVVQKAIRVLDNFELRGRRVRVREQLVRMDVDAPTPIVQSAPSATQVPMEVDPTPKVSLSTLSVPLTANPPLPAQPSLFVCNLPSTISDDALFKRLRGLFLDLVPTRDLLEIAVRRHGPSKVKFAFVSLHPATDLGRLIRELDHSRPFEGGGWISVRHYVAGGTSGNMWEPPQTDGRCDGVRDDDRWAPQLGAREPFGDRRPASYSHPPEAAKLPPSGSKTPARAPLDRAPGRSSHHEPSSTPEPPRPAPDRRRSSYSPEIFSRQESTRPPIDSGWGGCTRPSPPNRRPTLLDAPPLEKMTQHVPGEATPTLFIGGLPALAPDDELERRLAQELARIVLRADIVNIRIRKNNAPGNPPSAFAFVTLRPEADKYAVVRELDHQWVFGRSEQFLNVKLYTASPPPLRAPMFDTYRTNSPAGESRASHPIQDLAHSSAESGRPPSPPLRVSPSRSASPRARRALARSRSRSPTPRPINPRHASTPAVNSTAQAWLEDDPPPSPKPTPASTQTTRVKTADQIAEARLSQLSFSADELALIRDVWAPTEKAPIDNPTRSVQLTATFGWVSPATAAAALQGEAPYEPGSAKQAAYERFLSAQTGESMEHYTIFMVQLVDWNSKNAQYEELGRMMGAAPLDEDMPDADESVEMSDAGEEVRQPVRTVVPLAFVPSLVAAFA